VCINWIQYTCLLLLVPLLGAFAKLRKASVSFLVSVSLSFRLSARNNWAPTGGIFMKFDIWLFFEKLSRKLKFYWNITRITGSLHEDQHTFLIISRSVLLRTKNVSDRNCVFVFCNFFPENRAVYEKMWKNIVVWQATEDKMAHVHFMMDN